jgi:hypothetical protein
MNTSNPIACNCPCETNKNYLDANISNFCTLKQFTEFIRFSSQDILEEKPTVDFLRNYIRCFISGWEYYGVGGTGGKSRVARLVHAASPVYLSSFLS